MGTMYFFSTGYSCLYKIPFDVIILLVVNANNNGLYNNKQNISQKCHSILEDYHMI
ncbi:hypothetical protein ACJX0J_010123 [Zea mays]